MKRLFITIAIITSIVACEKSERLTIGFANAYDQTVIVSGNGIQDYSIAPGKTEIISYGGTVGRGNHIEVESHWKARFYDTYDSFTVYTEDYTVLESWTKDDTRPGNPFDMNNWKLDDESESGVERYFFYVSAYSRTEYTLMYIIAPKE